MKKLFSFALLMLFAAGGIFAQNSKKGNYLGKGGTPHEVITKNGITISYGRPYKKGREIFGGLEKFGEVWRLGADEATEITFDKGGLFGGKQISAGTYTMFAKLGKTEWTIILNSKLGQWGSFGYEKVKDKDVLQVTVPVHHMNNVVEQLTMKIEDNGLRIEWDNTSVFIPTKF